MRAGRARRLGGGSVLTVLVIAGVLLTGVGLAWANVTLSFYTMVDTGLGHWSVWAPGPSGVAYNADNNTMFVVDTDRTNYSQFDIDGINLWEIHLNGNVLRTSALPGALDEPTGVEYDLAGNRLFVTTDSPNRLWIFNIGPDGSYGTGDDGGSFTVNTDSMGADDTEDPAFDPVSGSLFFVSGSDIYEINPTNGALIEVIDISHLGSSLDFEGMAFHPPTGHLLLGTRDRRMFMVTKTGDLVQEIVVPSAPGFERISGMGTSPGPDGTGLDIWVADRRATGSQHTESMIDGRLFRFSTDGNPPPPTTTTTSTSTTTTTAPTSTSTSTTTTSTTTPTTTTTSTTTTLPPTTTTTLGSTTTTTTVPTTTTTIPTTTTTQPGSPPPEPQPATQFTDTSGHLFATAIEWLADEGITQGCNPPANTMFCPDDRVTRGQMAAFLVRAFNYTDNGGGDLFIDDNNSVFENAIDRLATAGVTQGCNPPNNTRYCPNDLVTRGQMAAFLGRAFNYTDNGGGDWFIDDNGSVFENAIDRLRTAGVTQGCNPPLNNRYCPNDFVTRGQMAAFLKRAFGA
ncbi:MAG TPA: S-layer homology domain-containing protein [Acidimicrobiia bacterium]|nr:S-layer homology domain-containing protein [Acidimicrobiia bacterium]